MRGAVRSFASSLIFLAASLPVGIAAAQDEMPAVAVEGIAATIATVQDVDQETREVTLRDPDGTLRTIVAGDEVRNFAQVKKGDVVLTEFYQGFAVALAPKGSGKVRRDAVSAARAGPGEKPAAVVTRTIDAVAVVEAVDRESRMVTVQGVEHTLILKAADDIDLDSVEVGQNVVASYIAAYAIAVIPSPKVSGNLAIESKAVALGVGIGWGSGTFTMYDGSIHELKLSGISFGDVGISSVELSGEVYQLTDPKDLAGPYVAAAAGATMGKGVSNVVLRNPKGVVMHLQSKQKGARLTLASAGVTVELVE